MTKTKNKDIFSKRKRSLIMSAIKSQNTGLEKSVFSILRKNKLRFKTHYGLIIGRPDIAIPTKKKAMFIDSDFWHGWKYPEWKNKLTSDFWIKKIETNRKRDLVVKKNLKKLGWKVLRIWEHNLKKDFDKQIHVIIKFLR